jgi:hypothetical protein
MRITAIPGAGILDLVISVLPMNRSWRSAVSYQLSAREELPLFWPIADGR